MTDSRDSRISELYRQSSQEMPPARLDHAVLDMARKSVRRRVLSPFGDHWIAAGATVTVVMLSVLLLLTLPRPPHSPTPAIDPQALSRDTPSRLQEETVQLKDSMSERVTGAAPVQKVPAAPESRFDDAELLQKGEAMVPEEELRAAPKRSLSGSVGQPATLASPTSSAPYYLQLESFRDRTQADRLKAELAKLGFRCDIEVLRSNDTDVLYRVRVGPYDDLAGLREARNRLEASGIEVRTVSPRE